MMALNKCRSCECDHNDGCTPCYCKHSVRNRAELDEQSNHEYNPYEDPMAKKWLSQPPKMCELCNEDITDSFIDGATTYGPWACMCVDCHDTYGRGLGLGKGQQYDFDGKDWWLVGGSK